MSVPVSGRERVTQYFPQGKAPIVDHSGKGYPDNVLPARDFLLRKVKTREQLVDRLFDRTTGQFVYKVEKPQESVYSMELSQLNAYLREQLSPIYELVSGSLDESRPGGQGFNKHDTAHIDRVTDGTIAALYSIHQLGMPVDIDDLRDTIIASRLHDLGNLFSRADHSAIGVDVALYAMPWLVEQPERLEKVREIVYYHDEPRIRDAIAEQEAHIGGHMTADEAVGFFSDTFGSVSRGLLALVIADKTDITRDRFSLKAAKTADPEACLQDRHLLANLFFDTTPFKLRNTQQEGNSIGFSEDGTSFRWEITFNPWMNPQETQFFESLTRHANDSSRARPHIPHTVYKAYKEQGVPVFDSLKAEMWRVYWDRMKYTVIAAFALNPQLQTFSIDMINPDFPGDTSSVTTERFIRRGLETKFTNLERKYFPEKDKRPSRRSHN